MEKEPNKSIFGRWLAGLQCYRFRVVNVLGAKTKAADALSGRNDGSFVAALASAYEDTNFPFDLRQFYDTDFKRLGGRSTVGPEAVENY